MRKKKKVEFVAWRPENYIPKQKNMIKELSKIKITTITKTKYGEKKITLAPTTDADIYQLCKYLDELDTIKYIDAAREITKPLTQEEKDKFFAKKQYKARFTIKNEVDEIIGSVSASVSGTADKKFIIEIGCFFGKKYQGNGYGTAASNSLCDEIFKDPDVGAIMIAHYENNKASEGLANRILNHLKEKNKTLKDSVYYSDKNVSHERHIYLENIKNPVYSKVK